MSLPRMPHAWWWAPIKLVANDNAVIHAGTRVTVREGRLLAKALEASIAQVRARKAAR